MMSSNDGETKLDLLKKGTALLVQELQRFQGSGTAFLHFVFLMVQLQAD